MGESPLGEKLFRIEVHHDRAELAAVRQRHGGALNGGQRVSDEVLPQVEQFLLAQSLAFQAQLQDGNAGGVVLDDAGREGAGWEDSQQSLGNGGYLRQRQLDLGVGLEIHANDGNAGIGLRFDVLDVVDRGGHGPLEDGDDAFFHLLGRQPAVGPHHADHGDIDVGKDVHRHGDDGGAAKNGDQARPPLRRYRGVVELVGLSTFG